MGISVLALLLPSSTWASEGSVKIFVSAWLVRLWLALIGGTFVVMGVILAMEAHSREHSIHPVRTQEGVVVQKVKQLSYLKIGQGLLSVFLGCLFFVSAVFLLPDKHTGHSGWAKVADRYRVYRSGDVETTGSGGSDGSKTAVIDVHR